MENLRSLIFASMLIITLVGYTFAATPINVPSNNSAQNSYIAVNLTNELYNSAAQGFNFTSNDFAAGQSSSCALALITACGNNAPGQYVCVNDASYYTYQQQRQVIDNVASACPQYLLSGRLSCVSVNGYCEVERNTSGSIIVKANSTNSTITQQTTTSICPTGTNCTSSININTNQIEATLGSAFNQVVAFLKGIFKSF
jgi:hypothetical protein